MKRIATALALSTLCLTSACGPDPKRVVEFIPTPPERLVCVRTGTRPTLPPEYQIDWSRVTSVAQAHGEHDKFVATLRTRENIVAGYIVVIEGANFTCWTNAEWRRQYEAGIKPR